MLRFNKTLSLMRILIYVSFITSSQFLYATYKAFENFWIYFDLFSFLFALH